jgi:hypothetical protein
MNNPFLKGFPLEKPDIILEWGKPLNELAKDTGGIWFGDRYSWNSVTYLQGLEYPLYSDNGIAKDESFKSITAYIGLNPEGLWEDKLSLSGFDKVSEHLIKIFGKPSEIETENELNEKSQSWGVGNIYLHLSVIEQHVFRCYLTTSLK